MEREQFTHRLSYWIRFYRECDMSERHVGATSCVLPERGADTKEMKKSGVFNMKTTHEVNREDVRCELSMVHRRRRGERETDSRWTAPPGQHWKLKLFIYPCRPSKNDLLDILTDGRMDGFEKMIIKPKESIHYCSSFRTIRNKGEDVKMTIAPSREFFFLPDRL